MDRKVVEARRGIERDENGHIVRSKEWLEQRVEWLTAKVADYENRIKNAKVEIKEREAELNEQ